MKNQIRLKSKFFSICTLFSLVTANLFSANLIFDMGDVIVKESRWSSVYNIGISNLIGLYNPWSLKKNVFDFLDLLVPLEPGSPEIVHNGVVLPQIMVDWICGHKTTEEIRSVIELGLEKHDGYFSTKSQKIAIAAICEYMFTPEKFFRAFYPVKDTLKLIKKCSIKEDKNGHKNRIFILTNWDAESFPLLYRTKSLRHLFRRADGIVVSGSVHMAKPDPKIFEYLLETFSINPQEELTVFVDDTLANLKTAKTFGIHPVHCKELNIKAVKKEFKNLGVL